MACERMPRESIDVKEQYVEGLVGLALRAGGAGPTSGAETMCNNVVGEHELPQGFHGGVRSQVARE